MNYYDMRMDFPEYKDVKYTKLRWSSWKQKGWYRHMDNSCINFRHCGVGSHMYSIHMLGKCRIDRLGGVSRVWRF